MSQQYIRDIDLSHLSNVTEIGDNFSPGSLGLINIEYGWKINREHHK